mgnify:CR=1 FL=1
MNTMKIAVKIAFMAAATIPAAASAQEAGRMLSLDEAVSVTLLGQTFSLEGLDPVRE